MQKIIKCLKINKNKFKNKLFNTSKIIKSILNFLETIEINWKSKKIKKKDKVNI